MNPTYSTEHWRDPQPTNAEALAFWKRGQADLDEAEKVRRTDWQKFSNLVYRGVEVQSAALALGRALDRKA